MSARRRVGCGGSSGPWQSRGVLRGARPPVPGALPPQARPRHTPATPPHRIPSLSHPPPPHLCRAGVRGFVLLRSQGRMLLQGGLGNLEQEALAASTSGRPAGGRPTEVFDAFARFREHHCRAALEEERGEGAGKGDEADGLGARGATLSSAEQATMEAAWQGAVGAADASAPLWWDRGACEPATGADPSTSSGAGPGVRPQSAGDVARAAAAAQARSARLLAAAEALHVLRPLIYAATLRRWGRRAWRPWLASLLVDLASRQLSFRAAATSRQAAYAAAASPAVQGTSMAVLYRLQGIRCVSCGRRLEGVPGESHLQGFGVQGVSYPMNNQCQG